VIVPSALFVRHRPEDIGLWPDAETPTGTTDRSHGARLAGERGREPVWGLAAAARTRTLWLLILGLGLGTLASSAITFHLAAYLTELGISPATAAFSLGVYGGAGALASGVWGFLTERIPPRTGAMSAMLIGGAAAGFLLLVKSPAMAIAFAVVFGLATRGDHVLVMIMIAHYFGRESYGTLSGFAMPFEMLALGLGPLVGALCYDVAGTYVMAFVLVIASFLGAAVAFGLVHDPGRGDPGRPSSCG
jgi:MFS family permease